MSKKKYNIQFAIKEFEKKDYTLLEECYKNSEYKMKYKCNKHKENIQEVSLYNLMKYDDNCKVCNGEKISLSRRHNFDYVKSEFEKCGYRLMEDSYVNNLTDMNYICPNHSQIISKIKFVELISGIRCKLCANEKTSKRRRHDIDFVIKIFEEKGFQLISEDYKDSHSKLQYRCIEHLDDIFETTLHIVKNIKIGCPKCVKRNLSQMYKGDKSYFWNGGKSSENETARNNLEYREWRNKVFIRDNFKCVCCKDKGINLNAHHIFNFSNYIELRYNLDNGVTLCEKCHIEFHNIYGRKNNDNNQLKEFLDKRVNSK